MKEIISSLILLVAMSSFSHAISFTDIEEWQPEKFYNRGDIVRLNYDIYLCIIPSKELMPTAWERRWRLIQYKNIREVHSNRFYRIGDVVSHEGRFYISRGMNVAFRNPSLYDKRRWAEFTHPGLVYDLPPAPNVSPAEESLVGWMSTKTAFVTITNWRLSSAICLNRFRNLRSLQARRTGIL